MAIEGDSLQCFRQRFNQNFQNLISSRELNKFYMDSAQYNDYIETVKIARVTKSKTSKQYRRLHRFDILTVGGVEKLVSKVTAANPTVKYFVKNEDMFDVLNEAHLAVGHGGKNRMIKQLTQKYKNVTQAVIMLYLKMCTLCRKKKKRFPKEKTVCAKMNNRCQVHFIDMQSHPDRIYKFVMIYQDHTTKFVQLRALENIGAEDVSRHLLDIFCIFGAPSILYLDNGKEFVNNLRQDLCSLWSVLKIVGGRPRNSQPQCDKIIQDVQYMLMTWMNDKQNSRWSEGVRFVQFMKNRTALDNSNSSPYAATFGCDVKVDLKVPEIVPVENVTDINNQTLHLPNIYMY